MIDNTLDSHYSTVSKVTPPKYQVVAPLKNLPSKRLFDNEAANKKFSNLNNDIYADSKKEKKRSLKTFIKWFGAFVLLVLGIRLIRR